MSLQGLGNTTVQVPSSLKAPSDVSALGSIHQGIDQSDLPTPQKNQLKSSIGKIYQSSDNTTLTNTDKQTLNPILNAGVQQGNVSLNPSEQSTLTGMQDKMNTSGK